VVIALGDPAQLGSVGAGGWFTHLVAHTADVPTLTTVRRQAGADLAPVRAALGALRADTAPTARAALERLAADGRIHLADSADTLLERAVADWYTERRRRGRATADASGGAPARAAAGAERAAGLSGAADGLPDSAIGLFIGATGSSAGLAGSSGGSRGSTIGSSGSTVGSAAGETGSYIGSIGSAGSAVSSPIGLTVSAVGSAGSGLGAIGLAAERVDAASGSTGTGSATDGSADGATGPQDGGRPGSAARPQPLKVHLMAERHREVETLNRAAHALLVADATLTGPALTVAGRQFQAGDEVITLTQAGHTLVPDGKPRSAYIRTGTVGVVTAVHLDPDNPAGQALSVYFPSKGTVHVPWEYLTHRFTDGRDGGLAHAYAITAARAQGTTMDTARAVVPDDTSRAGLYVMLSRARTDVAAYLVARDQLDDRDDDETWLPTEPNPQGPVGQLADRLGRSRPEQQAGEQDPLATTAHRLRRRHTLAELTALRFSQPTSAAGVPHQVVLRRAELAAEAALRAAALTNPPAALVARIGPRPAAGPDRATWEQVVGGLAIYHARHRPDVPPHEAGPPPVAGPHRQPADPWLVCRQQAVWLADNWAAALPPALRDRFGGPGQTLPRERAIAGLQRPARRRPPTRRLAGRPRRDAARRSRDRRGGTRTPSHRPLPGRRRRRRPL
jgi:hypothetical protein